MSEMKFTRTHEWAKNEQGDVIVGITRHAQELLGDLVFVELPEVGSSVEAGKEFGVVESVKAASDVYAPISGEVMAINDEVLANPALVNTHPESSGWLVRIKATNHDVLNQLLSADEYLHVIAEEA